MDQIRIHVGPMPVMLRAMIEDLLILETDMAIVGHSYAGEDSILKAHAQGANVLIAHERDSKGAGSLSAVLAAVPAIVLAISRDGRHGKAVTLTQRTIPLDASETPGLAHAIRHAFERHEAPVTGQDVVERFRHERK